MSGVSDKLRACPLWPGLAPPGRDPSRFALRSVDGGFEDVRDVLSGRCSRSTNSTNSGFVSPSSSLRFMDRMNHNRPALARGWVVTSTWALATCHRRSSAKVLSHLIPGRRTGTRTAFLSLAHRFDDAYMPPLFWCPIRVQWRMMQGCAKVGKPRKSDATQRRVSDKKRPRRGGGNLLKYRRKNW